MRLRGLEEKEGTARKKGNGGPSRRHEGCRLVLGEWRGEGRLVMKDQAVDSNMDLRGDTGSPLQVTNPLEKSSEAC